MNRKQRLDLLLRQRDEAIEFLEMLDEAFLVEAIRRHSLGANLTGFPTSSLGSGSSSKGDHSDRTGDVAVAHLRRPPKDEVGQAIEGLFQAMQDISNSSKKAWLVKDFLNHIYRKETGRPLAAGSGQCEACDNWCSGAENDRLRSLLCPKDRQRWIRAGRPDRAEWVRSRRNKLNLPPLSKRILDSGTQPVVGSMQARRVRSTA